MPPPNDDLANAEALVGDDSASGTTTGATLEDAFNEDYIDGNTVYYSWVPSSGIKGLTVRVTSTSGMEPWISVSRDVETVADWFGDGFYGDAGFESPTEVFVPVVNGETVYVSVDNDNGVDGSFTIETFEHAINLSGAGPTVEEVTVADAATNQPWPPTYNEVQYLFAIEHPEYFPQDAIPEDEAWYVASGSPPGGFDITKDVDNPVSGAATGDVLLAFLQCWTTSFGVSATTTDGKTWGTAGASGRARAMWRYVDDPGDEDATLTWTLHSEDFLSSNALHEIVMVRIRPGAQWAAFDGWASSSANGTFGGSFPDLGPGTTTDPGDITHKTWTPGIGVAGASVSGPALDFTVWSTVGRFESAPGYIGPVPGPFSEGYAFMDGEYTGVEITESQGTRVSGDEHPRAFLWGTDLTSAGIIGATVPTSAATMYQLQSSDETWYQDLDPSVEAWAVDYESVDSGDVRPDPTVLVDITHYDAGGGVIPPTSRSNDPSPSPDSLQIRLWGWRLVMVWREVARRLFGYWDG